MHIRCPKCKSQDILLGNNKKSNKCENCGHTWPNKDIDTTPQDNKAENFSRKLDNVISHLFE